MNITIQAAKNKFFFSGKLELKPGESKVVESDSLTKTQALDILEGEYKGTVTVEGLDILKAKYSTFDSDYTTGNEGSVGAAGPVGPKGDSGLKGSDGLPGAKGPKGDTGAPGPAGTPGTDGSKGLKGDTGPAGTPGLKGDTGPKGDPGLKGDTGAKGDTGLKGDTGAKGTTGAKGVDGKDGASSVLDSASSSTGEVHHRYLTKVITKVGESDTVSFTDITGTNILSIAVSVAPEAAPTDRYLPNSVETLYNYDFKVVAGVGTITWLAGSTGIPGGTANVLITYRKDIL